MNQFNDGVDFAIVSFFHKNFGNSSFKMAMWEVLTLPGDGVLYFPILLPIGIVLWLTGIFPELSKEQEYLLIYLYVVLVVDMSLNFVVKDITKRQRPSFHKHDLRFPGPDKYSFPSGHASRAGALVALITALLEYEPQLLSIATFGWSAEMATSTLLSWLWGWAVVNSIGRLALGRHFASDVILGTIVGYAVHFPVAQWLMYSMYAPPHGIAK
ncbi:acidPPc [Aphanomyces cochlioides]|nr:acidPPc [Aphanomyces cochlioides]